MLTPIRPYHFTASPAIRILSSNPGHAAAFFRTAIAGVGAPLTMIGLVHSACNPTGLANRRTRSADFSGKPRPPAHESSSEPADLGAILIQSDAFRHAFHVALLEARFVTMFALLGAIDAGVDAAFKFFVGHNQPPA
jgi:hypothetical protein